LHLPYRESDYPAIRRPLHFNVTSSIFTLAASYIIYWTTNYAPFSSYMR
jgi:hypothetical protein